MPKLAVEATRLAYETGRFKDAKKRSWLGFLPDSPEVLHDFLFGLDKSERRAEIMLRDENRCVLCGRPDAGQLELRHDNHAHGCKCDCAVVLSMRCGWDCHRKIDHVHPRLGTIPGVKGIER